jgi:outer membrane protein assembly factor BamE (lipoprotein component of BamABCDE complex)
MITLGSLGRLMRAVAIIAASFMLAACDFGKGYEDPRLGRLKVGESTEQDVRKLFGNPEAVRDLPAGKGLVYPLGPEGPYTLLIKIGPDGRYQGRENLLTRANFDRIYPGMNQVQVLALLGRPGSTESYRPKQQVAWVWKFVEGSGSAKAFVVTFDANGGVVSTAVEDEPKRTGG